MSAPDRVLGKAEAVLQIVEEKIGEVARMVDQVRQLEQQLARTTPDIEKLRDIVPDLQDVIQGLRKTTWMTSGMLAKHLSIHPDTVRQWHREGRIPGHRLGDEDHIRFDMHEVDRAVKSWGAREFDIVEASR